MNDPAAQSNPLLPTEDPDELLQQINLQIALQRARRLSGHDGNRRTARLLGALAIVGILMAAMGALFYLKATRYPTVTHPRAIPAPAASRPPVP